MTLTRRDLVLGGLAASAASLVLAACRSGGDEAAGTSGGASSTAAPASSGTTATTATTAGGATLTPTPACGDDPTPTQTEGPYFTSGSPAKANLAADVSGGTKLTLAGTVLTTSCQPVKQAKLDFWQADDGGEYDNQGFRLRGHVFTDDQGRYEVTTVLPGRYPGRTRHIHVKAQPPGGRDLTTQLYFPGEVDNASDGIYRKELEVVMAEGAGDGRRASFTFVLQA